MSNLTKNRRFVVYSCLIVTAVVYLPSLDNFLVADSWVFMLPHSFFGTFSYFAKTMLPPEFNALWLRPIPMFTFWFDTVLWPGTSWGPHLVNILFHLVNVWLIWLIMSGMKIDKEKTEPAVGISTAVMAACLVYGIHPLTVGSVGWVAARFDVMSVTFGLGGMYMWLRRETGDDRPRTLIVSIVLLLLSILSKEQGVVYAASCAGTSLVGALKSPRKRRSGIIGAGLIAAVAVMYLTYRTMVFNGLGGYLEARHGLSIKPPLYYFLAVLFPYRNVMGGSRISVTFIIAAFLIILMTAVLWKKYTTGIKQVNSIIVPAAAFLFVFGLATNAPNPGLTLERILGHAESRFALNAVAGFALLIGVAFRFLSHRQKSAGILLVVLTLWSITAAWRTDVQIQAWEAAGEKARTIVEETVRLAPDPPAGSKILFFDIPRNNDQWAYIFGIGLKEALMLRYGRSDITFIRYPTRDDLRAARPDRDYVLAYNKTTGHLERLRAKKQDTSQ